MMRGIRLRGLSPEHEEAILIGRRLLDSREPEERLTASWDMPPRRFHQDVEPHFRTEEQELLPAREEVGEEELVAQRTLPPDVLERIARRGPAPESRAG